MDITKELRNYVSEIGINLSELARKTNISYWNIYHSLSPDGERELKAGEMMAVCFVLHVNPFDLVKGNKNGN